jgi:hypothetical protein
VDTGIETIIFMAVILKIPVAFAVWLIYWAWKSQPEPAEAPEDDGGHRFRRFRREPKRPQGPRRGPHAPDAQPLPCPDEAPTRTVRRPASGRPLTASGERERRP